MNDIVLVKRVDVACSDKCDSTNLLNRPTARRRIQPHLLTPPIISSRWDCQHPQRSAAQPLSPLDTTRTFPRPAAANSATSRTMSSYGWYDTCTQEAEPQQRPSVQCGSQGKGRSRTIPSKRERERVRQSVSFPEAVSGRGCTSGPRCVRASGVSFAESM